MTRDLDTDPKGLIYESYRIEGISPAQCRSIFLDWVLSLPGGADAVAAVGRLLARYGGDNPDHPMTAVLTEGLSKSGPARRRGGWRSRKRG